MWSDRHIIGTLSFLQGLNREFGVFRQVDEGNGALREFCAELCREWLVWSDRHIIAEKGVALNAASLLRRLFDRLNHPNAYQRQVH